MRPSCQGCPALAEPAEAGGPHGLDGLDGPHGPDGPIWPAVVGRPRARPGLVNVEGAFFPERILCSSLPVCALDQFRRTREAEAGLLVGFCASQSAGAELWTPRPFRDHGSPALGTSSPSGGGIPHRIKNVYLWMGTWCTRFDPGAASWLRGYNSPQVGRLWK